MNYYKTSFASDTHDTKDTMKRNQIRSFADPIRSSNQDTSLTKTSLPHVIPNDLTDTSVSRGTNQVSKKRNIDNDTVAIDMNPLVKRAKVTLSPKITYQDTKRSIEEMRYRMNQMADQMLRNEASLVKERTVSWKINEKQRRFVRRSKEREKTVVDASSLILHSVEGSVNFEVVNIHETNFESSDKTKQSILSQASRMKRMSLLFQQLNQLQGILLVEIDNL